MTKGTKIAIGSVVGVLATIIIIFAYFISAKFKAEEFEASSKSRYEQMENIHGSLTQALAMEGFTVKNYGKTFIDTIDAGVKRYADKPQLMMQWVQEQRQAFPPDVHTKFMASIERFYTKWEISQKNKISVVQEYRKFLNASVKGAIAKGFFSYPTKEVQEIMDKVISSKDTKETFKAGVMKAVDPFKE